MNIHLKLTPNNSNSRRRKHTSMLFDFLIFKNLSCIMLSTKNILNHLITTLFYTNASCFTSQVRIKDPKRLFLLIRTYPFFWKIQCWQMQSSGVGRFPVNWHYVTVIISQSIPNPGKRNKGTKMQTLKQVATDHILAINIFIMIFLSSTFFLSKYSSTSYWQYFHNILKQRENIFW